MKSGVMGLALLLLASAAAGEFKANGIAFHYREPAKFSSDARILVLFGGRNWPGDRTLKAFHMEQLADRHGVFLLSPSFKDRDYWEPQKWSGQTLKKALAVLERKYHLKPQKIYFYGYSAGGQCSALFYAWMPGRVAAWGVHASGVYPDTIRNATAPALITCGTEDAERLQISRHFVYRYREAGGEILWKPYAGTGHGLTREALALAEAWFDALLSGQNDRICGEDDTLKIGGKIDPEFRNILYSHTIQQLWQKR